jgi:hypothetical protein
VTGKINPSWAMMNGGSCGVWATGAPPAATTATPWEPSGNDGDGAAGSTPGDWGTVVSVGGSNEVVVGGGVVVAVSRVTTVEAAGAAVGAGAAVVFEDSEAQAPTHRATANTVREVRGTIVEGYAPRSEEAASASVLPGEDGRLRMGPSALVRSSRVWQHR